MKEGSCNPSTANSTAALYPIMDAGDRARELQTIYDFTPHVKVSVELEKKTNIHGGYITYQIFAIFKFGM